MALLIRVGLALTFLMAIGVLALAASPWGRVAALPHFNECLLRFYTRPPEAMDIVIVGSSRIRKAVDPETMAEALNLPQNAVVNIGHPTPSLAYDYVTTEQVTRGRDVDIVLQEVIARSEALRLAEREIDPRVSAKYDLKLSFGVFKDLYVVGGTFSDQLRRVRREAPTTALAITDSLRLLSSRITKTLGLIRHGRIYPTQFRKDRRVDHTRKAICAWKPSADPNRETAAELLDRFAQKFAPTAAGPSWSDPAPLGFISDAERAPQRWAIDDMVALGQARGYTPVFIYMPGFHIPVDRDGLAAAFRERFKAELLIPPDDLREALLDDGYFDNSHLNAKGRRLLEPWLAASLAAILNQTGDRADAPSSAGARQ